MGKFTLQRRARWLTATKKELAMFAYCFALLQSLRTDRKGVTALEYGLLAALIAGVIVTAVTLVGTNLTTLFTSIAGHLVIPG
jgi:pilus assembly protein Flp/PilA